MPAFLRYCAYVGVSLCALVSCIVLADEPDSTQPSPTENDAVRIDRLERSLEELREENRRLLNRFQTIENQYNRSLSPIPPEPAAADPPGRSLVNPDDVAPSQLTPWADPLAPTTDPLSSQIFGAADDFRLRYDNGFVIVAKDPVNVPFSLKINAQNQIRLGDFARDAAFWTDSAGNQNPIANTNSFQIPRGRLIFSGHAYDPKLSYLLNIDYNSVTSNPIGFRAYEVSYLVNRGFEIHAGQSKVPGTREWIESGFAALEGPDRSMATTFFRPSLSQGVWINGEASEGLYYIAMVSNGFNTLNLTPNQLNNRYCWSGSTWWEPWGDFGRGYADIEAHQDPVIRLGTSYTFALGSGSQSSSDAVENSSIRLSDGTLITQLGALAPGVTLQSYDISLAAYDVSFKYRGLSFSTEWFAQELSALRGDAPLPISATRAYGGFVQGGYFVVPQTTELYARTSLVTGHYGSGSEVAGGVNWFPIRGKSNVRFTFDTAWLDNSPASQNRTGYVAGQTGLLVRTQVTLTY